MRFAKAFRLSRIILGHEDFRLAVILIGGKEMRLGGAFVAGFKSCLGSGFGFLGEIGPGGFPGDRIARFQGAAYPVDVEDIAAALLGLGGQTFGLGGKRVGWVQEINPVMLFASSTMAIRDVRRT